MFWSILHRAIFFELAKIFSIALVGITGILVMAGIVSEASQQGLDPSQVLMVIPLLIPSTLPYTIPATTLFATCVVYGRLAHDNEILAIRAAGVNLMTVVWPGALLGLAASAVTMGLFYSVIPTTHHMLRSRVLNDVEEFLYAILKKDHAIKQPSLGYVMFVQHVQGTRLFGALFKRLDKAGNYDVVARAKEAEISVDVPNRKIMVLMKHCEVNKSGSEGRVYFNEKLWPVDLPEEFGANRKLRPRAMTWPELFENHQEVMNDVHGVEEEIREANEEKIGPHPRPTIDQHLKNLAAKKKQKKFERGSLEAEIQMRPALACSCLCFVLVGCPVGIWFSRSDYLSAFITCFLPIVFLYYPLLLCGTNLAKSGQAPAVITLWMADALMALIAWFLFRRLLRN